MYPPLGGSLKTPGSCKTGSVQFMAASVVQFYVQTQHKAKVEATVSILTLKFEIWHLWENSLNVGTSGSWDLTPNHLMTCQSRQGLNGRVFLTALANLTHLISSHLSPNREGRWSTTDDFATSFLHVSLFSTALCDLAISRPVQSLMLSSHLFLHSFQKHTKGSKERCWITQNKTEYTFSRHLYVSVVHTSQTAGRTQPAADKLFVCYCNVRGLRKRIRLKMCILSSLFLCAAKKSSV